MTILFDRSSRCCTELEVVHLSRNTMLQADMFWETYEWYRQYGWRCIAVAVYWNVTDQLGKPLGWNPLCWGFAMYGTLGQFRETDHFQRRRQNGLFGCSVDCLIMSHRYINCCCAPILLDVWPSFTRRLLVIMYFYYAVYVRLTFHHSRCSTFATSYLIFFGLFFWIFGPIGI